MSHGQQPGSPPPAGTPPGVPPGYDWRYAPPPVTPPRRSKGLAVVAAIVLAVAALVVSVVDLTRSSTSAARTATAPTTSAATSAADTTAADHALCTAIAPLMARSDRDAKAYSSLGPAGSPGWDAGKEKYIRETKAWVAQVQPVIDDHPNVDPYLHRSLQRFVDDRRDLIADLGAGPFQPYDDTIWMDSLAAYSGPLSICYNLGVKW
jgi:hypothetical protein